MKIADALRVSLDYMSGEGVTVNSINVLYSGFRISQTLVNTRLICIFIIIALSLFKLDVVIYDIMFVYAWLSVLFDITIYDFKTGGHNLQIGRYEEKGAQPFIRRDAGLV